MCTHRVNFIYNTQFITYCIWLVQVKIILFAFNNGGTSGSRYVKWASTLREFLSKAVLYMNQQYILPTISKGKQQIKKKCFKLLHLFLASQTSWTQLIKIQFKVCMLYLLTVQVLTLEHANAKSSIIKLPFLR